MASIHTTGAWPFHATLRDIDRVIFHEWDERPAVGRGVFNVRESSQYQEDTLTAGGGGIFAQKLEGQPINYEANNEGFRTTFTHLDYGSGNRVTRNMLRDDLYATMEKLGVELARRARATEETILANHFNNGFDNSYTGGDGLELFSTAHVREDGSTYANELSSASDLSQTTLEQALIDFSDFRDGGGKRLAIEPKTLLVPKELRFEAYRLTNSSKSPEDDTNAANPLNGLLDVQVWQYLTDVDGWFILAAKGSHEMVLYDREEFWTDYEYDFDTKDYKITGMFAQSSGWGDPRGVFGTPGV
jgi:lambda repressor-like predicted transcriptional regulator